MKKKIFVIMSIFTLVLASFAGCESKDNNGTDKITTTVAPTKAPTVAPTVQPTP